MPALPQPSRCLADALARRGAHVVAVPGPAARRRHLCSDGTLRSRQQQQQQWHSAAAAATPGGGAAAAASPAPRPRWLCWLPDAQALALLRDACLLLYANLWAVVLVFAAKDAAAFVLHRVVHRFTNHIAESLLGIPVSTLGNPWWIMVDAKLLEGHIGYQLLVGAFFLLCLPAHIALNTAAVSTAAVVCAARHAQLSSDRAALPHASFAGPGRGKVGTAEYPRPASSSSSSFDDDPGVAASSSRPAGRGVGAASFRRGALARVTFRGRRGSGAAAAAAAAATAERQQPAAAPVLPWLAPVQQARRLPPLLGPRAGLAAARQAWHMHVRPQLGALWRVDLLFTAWALPLQAACLAVLPAFWAFPRLLGIQLALPAAALGGARGRGALEASRRLMAGAASSYAWPFAWLIAAARLLEVARDLALLAVPQRWWTDVIEVPLLATAAFGAARLLLLRLQDVLPLAAFLAWRDRDRQPRRAAA